VLYMNPDPMDTAGDHHQARVGWLPVPFLISSTTSKQGSPWR
jgi:hypothetical protein